MKWKVKIKQGCRHYRKNMITLLDEEQMIQHKLYQDIVCGYCDNRFFFIDKVIEKIDSRKVLVKRA